MKLDTLLVFSPTLCVQCLTVSVFGTLGYLEYILIRYYERRKVLVSRPRFYMQITNKNEGM